LVLIADIVPLLVSRSSFDLPRAAELVFNRLAALIPGDPWQGKAVT
jgi:hypothetical protein